MYHGQATWLLRSGDPEKEAALVAALGISPAVARILVGRGIDTPATARDFFDLSWDKIPSPWLLTDMEPAVVRLVEAIKSGELVTIYGDYDVDGMTATTLLVKTIQELGGRANYYIPRRAEEGYGLHTDALEEIAAESGLVVTVDCGITALAESEYAQANGLDLIITDHHQPGAVLPKAWAVINPNRKDCQYPTKELAGVGVALKLAHALALACLKDTKRAEAFVQRYLDLVALGTVADVVPLTGENRILAHLGLERFAAESVGLRALLSVARLDAENLSAGNLAFGIAPRLNALGRLDDAEAGVRLLLSDDEDEAQELAHMLDAANRERQSIERMISEEAISRVEAEIDLEEEWSIVLASHGWHPGVIGIVASRLVERFHRPTILISLSEEPAKGSGRSIEGFDLYRALQSLSHILERFGGHKMAAGLSIAHDRVEELRLELNKLARTWLTEEDLLPKLRVDAGVTLDQIDITLLEELEQLAPYGAGNPQPILMARDLVLERGCLVGKTQDHLKLFVSDRKAQARGSSFEAIGFRMAEHMNMVEYASQVNLAFVPKINEWNGRVSIDLVLKDIQLPAQEMMQQQLWRSIDRYQKVWEKIGRLAWEGNVECTEQAAGKRAVVDWRTRKDKAQGVFELLESPGTILLYLAQPNDVWSLAEKLAKMDPYKGRIGIYYGQMLADEAEMFHTKLSQGDLNLVLAAEPVSFSLGSYLERVVVYHLPLTPEELGHLWGLGSGEIYLAYNEADLIRARNLWPRTYPGWDELAYLYLALERMRAQNNILEISRPWCRKQGLDLEWSGICRALRIFEELNLVRLDGSPGWEKVGLISVKLLPRPKNKLDLTTAMGYNECVKRRDYLEQYGQWALRAAVSELQGGAWRDALL
ncbi:MAG: single-stranded-DNA-specific exonuclease RecJ [Firmicutes bacterium]|nr:single-stranded-DNA-specific exonuclease RecJ [Bacillota bacterium]